MQRDYFYMSRSRLDVSGRTERLASHIVDDFVDDNITVLCVLKGGYKFCADLVEFIKVIGRNSDKYLETRVEFIRLKSYLVGELKNDHDFSRLLSCCDHRLFIIPGLHARGYRVMSVLFIYRLSLFLVRCC